MKYGPNILRMVTLKMTRLLKTFSGTGKLYLCVIMYKNGCSESSERVMISSFERVGSLCIRRQMVQLLRDLDGA